VRLRAFVRPEPCGAEIEATIARPHRQQAATDPVTRFEHNDRSSGIVQQASSSKAGRASPHDHEIDRCGTVHVASLKLHGRSGRMRLRAAITVVMADLLSSPGQRYRWDLVPEADSSPGRVLAERARITEIPRIFGTLTTSRIAPTVGELC